MIPSAGGRSQPDSPPSRRLLTSQELRATLALAIPVIVAELGWITMGIVDTVVVGPLGPAAIGAVGTGSTMFFTVAVLGMGTLFALDTVVSQSFGAGRIDDCLRWLFAGLQLAVVLSALIMIVGFAGIAALGHAGLHPSVIVLLQPYLGALLWSVLPLMIFTVCRRYLQAMNIVRPVMVALVSANIINAVGNWMMVYGHAGAPALGAVGSAYATLAARVYLALFLIVVIVWRERRWPSSARSVRVTFDAVRIRTLVTLGAPAALQFMFEIGVFAAAAALAARITPVALAANQIVLNVAGFFFMIPYGLSSAAAVRVGQAVGRGDPVGARAAGWTAIALSFIFALVVSCAYLLAPSELLRIFTTDPTVITTGIQLLVLCAIFQPFDGFQSVSTGALRGLGDTRTPMFANLAGHWLIGLPVAYVACFRLGWGVRGLWTGLTVGIVLIGAYLITVWHRQSARATVPIALPPA